MKDQVIPQRKNLEDYKFFYVAEHEGGNLS